MIFFGERVRAELALFEMEPLLCLLVFVAREMSELESEFEDEPLEELEELDELDELDELEVLDELDELEELEELEELLELEDDEELETFSFRLVLGRLNIGLRGGASTPSFSSGNDSEQYSSLTTLPFTLHSSLGKGVQLDPGLV